MSQDLQASSIELGKFVQKQYAVVGEADFTRGGDATTTDHPGIADRVVRTSEGPRGHQWFAGRQSTDRTVDSGCFEALVRSQRRQNGRQPTGEHRLASARTANHQHVVTAGSSHRERTLRRFLPTNVGEVDVVLVEPGRQGGHSADGRFEGDPAREQADGVGQSPNAIHLNVLDDGRLTRVLHRHQQPAEPPIACRHRHRQRTFDWSHVTIERQFATTGGVVERFGPNLFGGDEQTERNRQIKRARVLAQVGRGKVDHRAAIGQTIIEIAQRAFDAMNALANRGLR